MSAMVIPKGRRTEGEGQREEERNKESGTNPEGDDRSTGASAPGDTFDGSPEISRGRGGLRP